MFDIFTYILRDNRDTRDFFFMMRMQEDATSLTHYKPLHTIENIHGWTRGEGDFSPGT